MNFSLRTVIALLSILAVIVFAIIDIDELSPGPLIPAHAAVQKLQGSQGCVLCHASDPSQLAAACFVCHGPIRRQVEGSDALHGNLDPELQALCGACHAEHLQASAEPLLDFTFRRAKLEGPVGFRHGDVDFGLEGRHDALACVDCHTHADAATLPEGSSRFLGLVQDCTSCHDDPHLGDMQRSCTACHGQEHAFDDLDAFPHDARIPLHGSHADLECSACHEPRSPYSVEELSDLDNPIPWRACASCHDSPHDPDFLAALPQAETTIGQDGCVLCHSERHRDFHGSDVVWQNDWHAASGFRLETPHADLECSACHDQRQSFDDFPGRYPGRVEDQCADCHDDPHAGQFDHAPYLAQGCLSCHARDVFLPQGFDLARHNRETYVLTDRHAETDCNQCHLPLDASDPATRIYRDTSSDCQACHQDAHAQAFQELEATLDEIPGGHCARCHQATSFLDMVKEFDHGTWTGFPLVLGHADQECAACHARSQQADASGRTLGWVSRLYPGDPAACDGCHADVHQGSFDLAGLPLQVEGRIGCDRCHATESFASLHAGGFDHGRWTPFPLTGAHQQTQCTNCHGWNEQQDRLGRVHDHYPGDAARCETCHADPHGGDFDRPHLTSEVLGRSGCARCHDASSFKRMTSGTFEHAYWTGFPLLGAHADADCTSCHSSLLPADALGRTIARAVGGNCTDCHLDPHAGQFLRAGIQDCLRCHDQSTRRFTIPDFDHDQLTRFALDDDHRMLDCGACHQLGATAQGQSVIRYLPLGISCQDCHQVAPDPGDGE